MKKFITLFLYRNIEIYNFFFPFNKKLINNEINKKKFIIKLYKLYTNFPINLQLKFCIFIFFIQISSIFFYFKFFNFLELNQKKGFMNKLKKTNFQILLKGLFAIRSQSIIIYYSIFKGKLNYER